MHAMFDQIKQLMQLKKMQEEITRQNVSVEVRGVKVTMRGDLDVTRLELNPELDLTSQAEAVIACLKEAKEKIQKQLAQTLSGSL
jgi:DNA-binding protein YbaB